jgi:hypothetical protein
MKNHFFKLNGLKYVKEFYIANQEFDSIGILIALILDYKYFQNLHSIFLKYLLK